MLLMAVLGEAAEVLSVLSVGSCRRKRSELSRLFSGSSRLVVKQKIEQGKGRTKVDSCRGLFTLVSVLWAVGIRHVRTTCVGGWSVREWDDVHGSLVL